MTKRKAKKTVYKGEGLVTLNELKRLDEEGKIRLNIRKMGKYSEVHITQGNFSNWEWRLFYMRLRDLTGFSLSVGEWYNTFDQKGWCCGQFSEERIPFPLD